MWKDKSWFTVYAPALFGNCEIGETLAVNPEELKGRSMETTLREVTGDFTQQHVKLHFQINDVKGGKAHTRFTGHDLTRDYVRMHVRRGTTRVDIITDVTTADGYKVRIRALAFTVQRVAASQSKAIRSAMRKVVRAGAERANFSGFIHETILGKLSADIHKEVKLIYPIKKIEVMKSKILEVPPEEEEPEEAVEEEAPEAEEEGPEEEPAEEPEPEPDEPELVPEAPATQAAAE
jgi:small subunit ribosomal protein S3Ae